jgi:hypothetical protein
MRARILSARTRTRSRAPAWNITLPQVPPYPEETEGWHAIDLKLSGRALDLRNHLAGSQGVIDATVEFAEQDLDDELEEHAGARGQDAWALAKDLRSRYGLPTFVPVGDYDGQERASSCAF